MGDFHFRLRDLDRSAVLDQSKYSLAQSAWNIAIISGAHWTVLSLADRTDIVLGRCARQRCSGTGQCRNLTALRLISPDSDEGDAGRVWEESRVGIVRLDGVRAVERLGGR